MKNKYGSIFTILESNEFKPVFGVDGDRKKNSQPKSKEKALKIEKNDIKGGDHVQDTEADHEYQISKRGLENLRYDSPLSDKEKKRHSALIKGFNFDGETNGHDESENYEGNEKFLGQLGVKAAHLLRGDVQVVHQHPPAGNVHRRQDQSLVHGQAPVAVAGDAPLVPHRLGKGQPQADADVLHRVVVVHLGVPVTAQGQVKAAVGGEQGQHMIQKATPGAHIRLPRPVQVQGQGNVGLVGLPVDSSGSHRTETSFM